MKRIAFLAICMVAMVAGAQESRGGFMAELGIGMNRYGNFPALSVMTDPTDSYGGIFSEQISLGYLSNNGTYYGLTFGENSGSTSALSINEAFANINVMLDIRDYFKLGSRMELELGVACGLLVHLNSIDDSMGDHHTYSRLGMAGHFSVGLHYMLSDRHCVGLRALPTVGNLMGDKPDLPTGLTATNQQQMNGFALQLTYSVRF